MKKYEHRSAVKALLTYSKKMDDWARPIENVRKMYAQAANAFLLGVMFDRSIKADRAWEAAGWPRRP